MGLFDGFRALNTGLQSREPDKWSYLRNIAQQQGQGASQAMQAPGYSAGFMSAPQRPPFQTSPGGPNIPGYAIGVNQSSPGMAALLAPRRQTNHDRLRRLRSQLDQARSRLNVQYDPSQFSDKLNYYLNNRVLNWSRMSPESRNMFLGRLVGFRELENARRSASPEYAALAQQYAAAPRGLRF